MAVAGLHQSIKVVCLFETVATMKKFNYR